MSGQAWKVLCSLPRILLLKRLKKPTSFSSDWICRVHSAARPLDISAIAMMHFKRIERMAAGVNTRVKQCLCWLLMENLESNLTKTSNRPSWVILEGSSFGLTISCQRGSLAGVYLSGRRLQKSFILFSFTGRISSLFPAAWSDWIIV